MPESLQRPALARTRIATGALLFVLLVVSAAWFSAIALRFGIDAIDVLREFGIEDGLEILRGDLQDMVLAGTETGIGEAFAGNDVFRFAMLTLAGFDATILFLSVFVASWLALAWASFRLIGRGLLELTPELDPVDVPRAFSEPTAVARQLRNREMKVNNLTKTERLMLGRYGPYLPEELLSLARSLSRPASQILGQVGRMLFFGALTISVIQGMLVFAGAQLAIPLPPVDTLLRALSFQAVGPLAFWTAVAAVFAALVTALDFKFLRAILPSRQPEAQLTTEPLRDLSWNGTPPQLITAIETDFQAEAAAHVLRMTVLKGNDVSRTNFTDQSDFQIELLIEAPCRPNPAYFARSMQRRAMIGYALHFAAAALLLLVLCPSPLRDLFAGRPVEAVAFLSATVHMVLVIALSRRIARTGSRYLEEAERFLDETWFDAPLALVTLSGTVNTQRVMTGKSLTDSTGTETSQQEMRFNAAIYTATAASFAPDIDGSRKLWSFAPDAASEALGTFIATTLLREGDVSVLKTARRTLRDTEDAQDMVTDRRRLREQSALPVPLQQIDEPI
ncbi:hypothetical protein PVT71_24785 (plasmid) [Salipiger sp. H15]|uniref:Uncharacterized protein n=1 Tax=Alloyangia sp. H15 TaxID=3029062 RepID=A0AAU8AT39_9RHOB